MADQQEFLVVFQRRPQSEEGKGDESKTERPGGEAQRQFVERLTERVREALADWSDGNPAGARAEIVTTYNFVPLVVVVGPEEVRPLLESLPGVDKVMDEDATEGIKTELLSGSSAR